MALPPVVDAAIIGGGFSGSLTALQLSRLAREADKPLKIALFDASALPARGLAYSTRDPGHLLNVRTDRMSAFPDAPDDFARWLATQDDPGIQIAGTPAGEFVSRSAYGRYLAERLAAECDRAPGMLEVVQATVTAISPSDAMLRVDSAAEPCLARTVVLAMGNLPSPFTLPDGSAVTSPWSAGAFDGLQNDDPVLVIGTGLTMVDIVTSLRARGHRGPVTALSRRGLVPRAHAAHGALPDPAGFAPDTGPLSRRLKHLRAAAQRHGWRETMDSLRPHTRQIWRAMDLAQKRRFLRHARPWWDVHRHRIAAPVATALAAEIEAGSLTVLAGRITGGGPGGLDVSGHGGRTEKLHPARILDATGFGPLARSRDPLVRQLLGNGLVRTDPLGLGLDVDDQLAVRGSKGADDRLYALGPMVRGVFWECTAVPDIRVQAEALASRLAASLYEDRP